MSARIAGSIDTNLLVRMITNDNPTLFSSAVDLINSGGLFCISDVALVETIYVIEKHYHTPRKKIAAIINTISSFGALSYNVPIFSEALELYVNRPSLSIEDCYMAIKAKSDDALPLWTFDKKLAGQSGGLARELRT